jgi:hypothetical protein
MRHVQRLSIYLFIGVALMGFAAAGHDAPPPHMAAGSVAGPG